MAEFRGEQFRVPPHIHTEHDETVHVLEGSLGVMLGEETFTATAGTTFTIPIGVMHSVYNDTEKRVRFLNIIAPASYLSFFDELAAAAQGKMPAPEVTMQVMAKFGLKPVK